MQWQSILRQFGLAAILAGALPVASFAATETELTPRRVQTETIKSAPAEEAEPADTDSPLKGVTDGLSPTPGQAESADDAPADGEQDDANPETVSEIEQIAPPVFSLDPATLPDAVRATRQAILDAAENADFAALRAVMDRQSEPPILSFGGVEDPIEYLKSLAGDPDGLEILAILIEVLEAGHAHLYPDSSEGHFLWPYYAAYPTDQLTPQQRVDMFKLLTAGDYSDMQDIGSYFFFRLGISENGAWIFFVAGD